MGSMALVFAPTRTSIRMTTLTRSKVLYYKRCLACRLEFVTPWRNGKCPHSSALSEVYGIKEIDTPTTPEE